MFAPAIQHQQQQKKNQSEPASSAEEDALKWNTDCVYFLASPLTCKKGAECEYRHSEYARMNPRDCYYWLSGNCLNPKCGFRHPPLEAPPGGAVQPPHAAAAPHHPGVVKQPVPCVFFQKGMCAKGDMCSFMHTPNPAGYRRLPPAEAKPAGENYTGEKKLPDASLLPKAAVKAHVDVSSGPRDSRGVEGGYEQKKVVASLNGGNHSQLHGSDDSNGFHNGKDGGDDAMRESSPGFNVLVDKEAGDSEYYHVDDGYGRRSQERRSEYDPDFIALAGGDGDGEGFRDRRAWGNRRVSSERGERSERRAYVEDERSENILASDLRYRLAKQRRVGSHEDDDSPMERGYRDSRRGTPRESSVSSSRLQGRIKLRERSNGDEGQFDRRSERGRDRSEFSSQGRLRDRIKGRLEENHSGNQERGLGAPWARRREMEDERRSETKSSSRREESKTGTSLGKRKSLEDDHPHKPAGDSFAAPLPFSEILKRKRAAASGGGNSNNKDQTREETMISKEEAGDETKLVTEERTEVVVEPKPIHHEEAEVEVEEGTIQVEGGEEEEVYEGNEEEQAYEGEEVNEEYYYEEGYEEGGEYAYEEGEEVVYAAEEAAAEED